MESRRSPTPARGILQTPGPADGIRQSRVIATCFRVTAAWELSFGVSFDNLVQHVIAGSVDRYWLGGQTAVRRPRGTPMSPTAARPVLSHEAATQASS